MRFLWIAIFGLIGVFSRYGVDSIAARFLPTTFPIGTFAINIVGSFLAGSVYVFGVETQAIHADLRIGLMVGLLGGFTTFSAFSIQSAKLFESGLTLTALAYCALSPLFGVLAAFAGLTFARGFIR